MDDRPTPYRAMIGSTALDLAKERIAVEKVCNAHDFLPKSMELRRLRPESGEEGSLKMVAECDLYILLLAFRYGSRPRRDGPSYTEIEFREALRTGKKILVFQMADNALVRADSVERGDDANRRLDALRALAREGDRWIGRFKSAQELAHRLADSLPLVREQLDREAAARLPTTTALPVVDEATLQLAAAALARLGITAVPASATVSTPLADTVGVPAL